MSRHTKSLADQLRAAIAAAERRGVTRYQIAQTAGMPQSTLREFVNTPDRQLRTDIAERIAEALGGKISLDLTD